MTGPEEQGAAASAGRLLAGHADREHVVQALQDAFVQGRLSRDEFGVRAGGALAARTYGELAALTADIPGARPSGARSSGARSSGARSPGGGRRTLAQRRPVAWVVAGSGSCLAIALGLVFLVAHVIPDGPGDSFQAWRALCALMALAAVISGIGVFTHGLSIADSQGRTRRRVPSA